MELTSLCPICGLSKTRLCEERCHCGEIRCTACEQLIERVDLQDKYGRCDACHYAEEEYEYE